MDNAGYELANDLFFADFLTWSGLAKKVIFHGKAIPWFVSDVTPADFDVTLKLLQVEVTSEQIQAHVNQWKQYLHTGNRNFFTRNLKKKKKNCARSRNRKF